MFAEDEVRAANAMQKVRSISDGGLPLVQDMYDWDGDDDGCNSTKPKGRAGKGGKEKGGWKGKGTVLRSYSDDLTTPTSCNSTKPKGRVGKGGKDKGKVKGKGKIEISEADPFKHQVCFDWSRKIGGCSETCPKGRKHACEHCGSLDHRGIEHDDAVHGVEGGQDLKMDQSNDKDEVHLPILEVEVEDNPKDFGFLLRGASPVWSTKICSPCDVPQLTIEKPAPPLHELDEEDIENEDSNSKRARMWNSQPKQTGQPDGTLKVLHEQQSAADKEKTGFSHQRCFEWSRKACGCSFPCPKNRLHVCEFCGSPDHRGVDHTGEKSPDGVNMNGKRIRLNMKAKPLGKAGEGDLCASAA
jgi:hypothetical protein